MRGSAVLLGLVIACGPGDGSSDSLTTGDPSQTSASTGKSSDDTPTGPNVPTGSTGSTGSTTSETPTTGADNDWLPEHGPCPTGDECSRCVQSEGASICGAECFEYGPGFVRCPASSVQSQSSCVWGDQTAPPRCVIMCTNASDCPDPGMVCVACPEPFTQECGLLAGAAETGPEHLRMAGGLSRRP